MRVAMSLELKDISMWKAYNQVINTVYFNFLDSSRAVVFRNVKPSPRATSIIKATHTIHLLTNI